MKTSGDNARQDLGLVKPTLPLSFPVQGNRHNSINTGVAEKGRDMISHEAAQMSSQGIPPPVLEEEEDLTEGIIPVIEKG